MKTSSSSARTRGGFTLVELMVVMTIIGILASLLMVAVNAWKEKARRAACLSNLTQIHTLIITYANGHDDELPPATPPNAPVRLTAQMNSLIQANITRNEKIFQCASRKASGPGASGNDWHYEYNPSLTSRLNSGSGDSGGSGGDTKQPLNLSLVRNPASTAMIWDSDDEDRDGTYEAADNHGNAGGNVLYVDGHVQWINGGKFIEKNLTEIP